MSYAGDWNLLENQTLRERMTIACAEYATTVVGETTAGSGTRRDKRHDLALAFLASPRTQIDRFMMAIIAKNHPADANVTDAQILTAVQGVWDDLAGVKNTDT